MLKQTDRVAQLLAFEQYQSYQHMDPVSYKTLWNQIWFIGLITYGGPLAHTGIFKNLFVDKLKWINSHIFMELTTICQSIPGPTSTQLLIIISMISTDTILGGLIAFLIFVTPSFLFLIFVGFFFKDYFNQKMMAYILMFLEGVLCVAVAVIAQAFWGMSTKYRNNRLSFLVIIICAIIYVIYPTIPCMVILFTSSATFSFLFKTIPISQQQKQRQYSFVHNKIMGKSSFVLFLVLFFLVLILPILFNSIILNQVAIFYRIGSIIIGGGHVVLPIMLNELQKYAYITPRQFWNGFGIISCLPGPMFNITSYIGYLINGVLGSIICTISINLPAILSLLAVLPYWNSYRSNQKIQKIIDGLCCASLGLIASASYLLLDSFCLGQKYLFLQVTQLALVVLGYYLIEYRKWPIFFTMLLAGTIQFPLQLMKVNSQSN